ncbi:MAG: T9SS type A sorting domain-containing protein [Ignavibacteria bacterium]
MRKFFIYLSIFFLGVLIYVKNPGTSSAQWDDPRYDRVPDNLRTNDNSNFSSPASVVTINDYDNFDIGVDFSEVHIVMNPRNPLQSIAAWNNLSSSIGAKPYYTINGVDWTAAPNPSWAATMAGDPVLAYDSLGNCYFENMYGGIVGTKVATSSDNGQTWANIGFGNTGNDKNWIAADQTNGPYSNYVYTVMTPGNFKRSTDRGLTFTQTFSSTNSLPGNMVCVGPSLDGTVQGGSVYFVTSTGSAFNAIYTFNRSTDGGATFNFMSSQNFANTVGTQVGGRNSVQNLRTRPYPFICADNSYGPNRGRFYVIYASNTPVGNGNKPDVFSRYSTDGGTTWSAEVTVNDDVNSQLNNQFMPAPWCDKETGKLYVQWMDTRDCPTSDSALIYASYSTDGGVTFAANQPVSNKKFRINCTQCNGGVPAYLGDYNAITSNSKTSMLAWTDFRNNSFGNYVAYFPDYALRMNPTSVEINSSNFAVFRAVVPSVKLYNDVTTFEATVTPPPASGSLTVSFPGGNTLSSYPDSLLVRVNAAPLTSAGIYSVKITANGSNGTPVHVRTVTVTVGLVGISSENEIATSYELSQNYPNPFNPSTKISYNLLNQTNVSISVFDAMGKLVSTINKGTQEPGSHSVVFNANNLSSGVYYYKLVTDNFTDTKKMLLIK